MAIEKYVLPLKEITPISEGGTGATTPEQARINLGIEDGIPVGTIIAYAGNTPPNGFLACDGAGLNPVTYDNLFGVIGTTYGGDGYSTFNLPNLNNNSFLEGSDTAGTVKSAGLPNATGDFVSTIASGSAQAGWSSQSVGTGALYRIGTGAKGRLFSGTDSTYNDMSKIGLDLSKSNSIFGKSTTVQPKSVTVKFCIKY